MHTEKECSITGLLLYLTALLTSDMCRKKSPLHDCKDESRVSY